MKFLKSILSLFGIKEKPVTGNSPVIKDIVKCNRSNCDGIMVQRKSNTFSCSEYPDCDNKIPTQNFDWYRQKHYTMRIYNKKNHLFPEKFVVIDFETTGLNPKLDRIIEVAAIKYNQGKEEARFTSLIKYEGNLPEIITKLTGLTNQHLQNQPNELTVMSNLREFIGDITQIAAHNAKFDLLFLGYALKRHNLKAWSGDVLCTYLISRLLFPLAENGVQAAQHKLPVLCHRLSIPFKENHRALDDALACGELIKKMWDIINNHGLEEPFLPVADFVRGRRYKISYEDVK